MIATLGAFVIGGVRHDGMMLTIVIGIRLQLACFTVAQRVAVVASHVGH